MISPPFTSPANHQLESAILLLAFAVLAAGCNNPDSRTAQPAPTSNSPPWFEDITSRAGLDFHHDAGVTGRYLMPEQMGSGCALIDYDQDGKLDLFLVQNGGLDSAATHRLYHQEANGTFRDVTHGSGLDIPGRGMGAAVGDINNDGRPDLLLTEYLSIKLFLNQGGGKFLNITAIAGLDNPRWASSAAFFDYDRDGWLDLVVGNYLDYDPTQECLAPSGQPEFCGPHGFPGLVTRLFRNLGTVGSVRFEDVTVSSGLAHKPGPALGVVCADFTGDGWPDIFLADDGRPNRLFVNQQDRSFKEEASWRGLAYNAMGQNAGDMGVAIGDVNGDGLFDLFVTHLKEELHTLWVQNPAGLFQDQTATARLNAPLWQGTGFGTVLADFDSDGDLDLAFVNGRVKRAALEELLLPGLDPVWAPYAQRNQLFANTGSGQFQEISLSNPAFCGPALVGRGLAAGDINNDGAMDLLVTSTGGPALLLQNNAPHTGHWLIVRAIDPSLGGRDAYGSEIVVSAGSRRWWRLIQPGYSYLSSGDPRAHVGLGSATAFDAIQVAWPDGSRQTFPGGTTDQIVVLQKGT